MTQSDATMLILEPPRIVPTFTVTAAMTPLVPSPMVWSMIARARSPEMRSATAAGSAASKLLRASSSFINSPAMRIALGLRWA